MMAEDLGVEAKEAAVREVAKLLSLPEHLLSIASIKADYIGYQQLFRGLFEAYWAQSDSALENDAHLSTMVAEQVNEAQAGLDTLSMSQTMISHLRENFVEIEKLRRGCQTLIENHDQIKLLGNARNNLNTTLKHVEGMMPISNEARDSLSEDKEVVNLSYSQQA